MTRLLRTVRLVPLAALVLAVGLPAASAVPASAATTTYTVTELGSLGGGGTVGVALNNNGQVTGSSDTSATITFTCGTGKHRGTCTEHPQHAFLYSNGTMTDLGTLGGTNSAGKAINLSGEVVGWAQTSTGSTNTVLFNDGKITNLTAAGLSGVSAINDSGQMAGTDGDGETGLSQVFLDSNGTITQLPFPPSFDSASPATGCEALAVNNNGVVLGGCSDASSDFHAVVWQNGTPTDLGTLGGPQTEAAAINNNGQVTGFSQTSTDADHGFLWSNGKMTDLGLNFFPAAINDNDVIVGVGGEIYSNGTLQNLNNLVPAAYQGDINDPVAINDNGQILATTEFESGETLLLTPN